MSCFTLDFYTIGIDGITSEAKNFTTHVRMLTSFIMYYKRKGRENVSPITEDDVKKIYAYYSSLDYHDDLSSRINDTSYVKDGIICSGVDDVAVYSSTQEIFAVSDTSIYNWTNAAT